MAYTTPFWLITLIVAFSLLSSTTLSQTTTVLDVPSSLQQALEILSFDPQTLEALSDQTFTMSFLNSSSTFSLPLHSRELVLKAQHEDYKSLVLSRLHRDSARVNSLVTKLQLALNNIDRQDLKPVDSQIRPEDLNTPVVSGMSQGSGEYFSRVGVGSPPKNDVGGIAGGGGGRRESLISDFYFLLKIK